MPSAERWARMGPEERERYRQWTRDWQHRNRERMREINRTHYAKKGRTRNYVYHKRVKQVRFTDELTKFVTAEAHDLRKRRNSCTGLLWHVDHTIPLKGDTATGLHIWSNLQVIPASQNYAKRNKVEEMTKFPS